MIGNKLSNRYEILRELGRGGMGVVYLGHDPLLDRQVAVKVMMPNSLTVEAAERFKREAHVVAQMDHPAIVGVYDTGEHEECLFFVMPLLPGTNLRSFLKEAPVRLIDVLDMGIQVADALEYSHSKGIIHRDIKPENVMVNREEAGGIRVRITDFGLAMVSSAYRLTRTGALVGTIAYLSPEQVSAETIDSRSDIYSLGTLLYECLVGEPPFSGEIQSVLYRIANELPQSPRLLGVEIREELEGIVMQCLEKDPAKRPQRAQDVSEGLTRYRSRLREKEKDQEISTTHRGLLQYQRRATPHLIGREKEFAELQQRLNAALHGECQFAVVGGSAGIGKSRLVEELEHLAKARRIPVLHGRFVERDQALPYHGFCEAIQEYFRTKMADAGAVDFSDLSSDLVSLFPVLAEVEEIRSSSSAVSGIKLGRDATKKFDDPTSIFDLLARSLIRIAGGKPLILFLEDLHAANVSLDALQYIVRRFGPTPTLIVGTYRTADVERRHSLFKMMDSFRGDRRFVSIKLEPFLPSEHFAFLEALIGSSNLEQSFVDKLYEATEGNPFFTEELVRSLLDSEGLTKTDTGSWNLSRESAISSEALPQTIQQAIEVRIERLPKNVREAASMASILGRTFEFRDLILLVGKKQKIEACLEKLLADGFIEEERESRGHLFTFASGLVRDVLYGHLSRQKRKSLHRKYAEQLEKRNATRLERVYAQLVHHYTQGDVPDRVIEYGLKLARKSLEALSVEDALRAVGNVMHFIKEEDLENTPVEGEARTLLAEAHRMSGNITGALQELEHAIQIFEQHKDTRQAVRALVKAAETAWDGRKIEESRGWVEKGLEAAAGAAQETESLIKLLSLGATLSNLRGEYEKAREYMQKAERLQPAIKEREEIPVGGELIVAIPVAIQPTHPGDMTWDEEQEIFANSFETLVTMDDHGHLVPCLCEQWEVLEGGKSFLFTIRQNVRMHDGRNLDAPIVKDFFERAIRRSRTAPAYPVIAGALEFSKGTAEAVSGLEVLSERKLMIRLMEPLPIYPALLTDVRMGIVVDSLQDAAELPLIGTGPYRLTSLRPGCVRLDRNPDYWKGSTARLDAIEFRIGINAAEVCAGLRSDQIDLARDLLPEDLEEILQDRRFRSGFVEATKKNLYFVLFHKSSPIAGIPAVRKALCGAIRTQDLVRATLGRYAQPAEGMFPPGILGHNPGRRRLHPLDHVKALELLESSKLSFPIHLKAAVHPLLQDRYASLTKAVLKVWSDLGVEVSIETPTVESFIEYYEKNEGIDLMFSRWVADYHDPDNFTYCLFHSIAGENRHYFSCKEMDQLMEEARAESNPAVRERIYQKNEDLLMETAFFLPLFHEIDYRIAGPRVRGLTLLSTPPYVNYAELGKSEKEAPRITQKSGTGFLIVPFSSGINSLDPSLATLLLHGQLIPTIFETLTREAEGAGIVPWLASEFCAEEGSRRFRFRLRKNVRFHNGQRLTARDVRYSFERLLQNRETPTRWLLSPIRGAQALLEDKAGELEGFKIQSDSEFTIDLDQPISFFPTLLTHTSAAIVPEGTNQFDGSWREGCVGTGPFRVVRFDPGRLLELESNPTYWREGFPKADGLIFRFGIPPQEILSEFRAGHCSLAWDLFPGDVDILRREPDLGSRYREMPRLSTYFVVFNSHRGPFCDKELRRAFVQGIDMEGIVSRNLGRLAIPAYTLIPPGLLGYEAAAPRISGPVSQPESPHNEIELTGMTHSIYDGPYSSFARELLKVVRDKGYRIRIAETKSELQSTVVSATQVDFDARRWIADYPDADTFVQLLLHSQRGILGPYCGSPEIDRLIDRGRVETIPELRHEIYRRIEQIIARQALLMPLFHEQAYGFARPEVEGFELVFSNRTIQYENLWIRR